MLAQSSGVELVRTMHTQVPNDRKGFFACLLPPSNVAVANIMALLCRGWLVRSVKFQKEMMHRELIFSD